MGGKIRWYKLMCWKQNSKELQIRNVIVENFLSVSITEYENC
jgi:hypothetical protein